MFVLQQLLTDEHWAANQSTRCNAAGMHGSSQLVCYEGRRQCCAAGLLTNLLAQALG